MSRPTRHIVEDITDLAESLNNRSEADLDFARVRALDLLLELHRNGTLTTLSAETASH